MQQQVALPIQTVGGFTFSVAMIAGIDWNGYQPGEEKRAIDVFLSGGHVITFEGPNADALKMWFDQVTGQARIIDPNALA